jgi:chromosome segregation ATPase
MMATVEMKVDDQSETIWKSPLKKLVRFFQRSRDQWKTKYAAKKQQYKRMSNQARAVEKSRAKWRQVAEQAQQQVRQLQDELEQYKKPTA